MRIEIGNLRVGFFELANRHTTSHWGERQTQHLEGICSVQSHPLDIWDFVALGFECGGCDGET